MRVLAIGAHPDDVEINCAGTLAKYKKQGHEVFIAHACTGDKGHFIIPPDEMGKIRVEECRKAGATIGAQVYSLGYGDAEIEYNQQTLEVFVHKIREISPDVLITHTPDDYHLDHVTVSRLVTDASFLVSVPFVHPTSKATDKVPQLYYMEPYTGISFLPQEFVDITETLEAKLGMMRCHASQLQWLQEHDNVDILDFIKTSAKYRGFQCGVSYAEGFVRCTTALRAVPGRFLP